MSSVDSELVFKMCLKKMNLKCFQRDFKVVSSLQKTRGLIQK